MLALLDDQVPDVIKYQINNAAAFLLAHKNISKGPWWLDLLPKSNCLNAIMAGNREWTPNRPKLLRRTGRITPTPRLASSDLTLLVGY